MGADCRGAGVEIHVTREKLNECLQFYQLIS